MVLQISFGDLTAMDPGPIPNQDEFARDIPAKMVERFNEFLTIDGAFKMPFVDLAR